MSGPEDDLTSTRSPMPFGETDRPSGLRSWSGWLVLAGAFWFRSHSWIKPGLSSIAAWIPLLLHPATAIFLNWTHIVCGVAVAIAVLFVGDALGRRVFSWIGLMGRITRLARPALGVFILSLLLLGIGLTGLFSPGCVLTLGLIALAVSIRSTQKKLKGLIGGVGEALRGASWLERGALLVIAGWMAILASTPEVDYDCLQYHLSAPQSWMRSGLIHTTNTFWYAQIPLPMDLLNVFGLLAGSHVTPRFVNAAILALGGFAVLEAMGSAASLAERLLGVIASALWASGSPVFFTAKNDAAAAGFGLLGLALLIGQIERGGCRRRILAACLLGCAAATKYVVLPPTLLLVSWCWIGSGRGQRRITPWLAFGAPLAPWLIKGFLAIGDPLYPIGTKAFPSVVGLPWRNADLLADMHSIAAPRADEPFMVPLLGYALPMLAMLFAAVPVWRRVPGPALAAAVLLGGLVAQALAIPDQLFSLERFGLFQAIGWNLIGWSHLARSGLPLLRTSAAIILTTAGLLHATSIREEIFGPELSPARYVSGLTDHATFSRQSLGTYGRVLDAWRVSAATTGSERCALAVGDTCMLDAPARLLYEANTAPLVWSAVTDSRDATRIGIRMRQLHVGWILLNSERSIWGQSICEPYSWSPQMLDRWARWCRTHLILRASSDRFEPLYGTHWLFSVSEQSVPAHDPLLLPGIDRALCHVKIATSTGQFSVAVNLLKEMKQHTGRVAFLDGLMGKSLAGMGLHEEGYALLKSSVDAGIDYDLTLWNTFAEAGNLHKKHDLSRLAHLAWNRYPHRRTMIMALLEEAGIQMPGDDVVKIF